MSELPTARKLATIEQVTAVTAIAGADRIVAARVRGWDVVIKKGELEPGDLCVYFEVDSLLDTRKPALAYLAERSVRTDARGRRGHVLKTARLRGKWSQGLAVPIGLFGELGPAGVDRIGEDVTAALGVVQWDPPIPADLIGATRGYRPLWIRSTDQERLQNQPDLLTARGHRWVATEKLDGTSTTFWVDGDEQGACTRNVDLVPDPGNRVWKAALELGMHDLLRRDYPGVRAAVQGELYGLGSHVNPLKLDRARFSAFTLRVGHETVPRAAWPDWLTALSVPVHDLEFPETVEQALEQVDGLKSKVNPDRAAEGIVWVAADTDMVQLADGRFADGSFKVISNRYLLKHDR
jgi:RNA ligase (TIGR02306 family)